MDRKQISMAVIGSGRIGSLRAAMAAAYPGVQYLAVSDIDAERVRALARKVGAHAWSTDNAEIIVRPEVDVPITTMEEAR